MNKNKVYEAMWIELMKEITENARYRSDEQERNAYIDVINKMAEKQVKYMLEG